MIIKIAFLCASFFAVSATEHVETVLHNTGISSTSKHQDSHGNYAFSYDIVDEHGARNSRAETGDAFGTKKGSYSLYDTDGRARRVDYIADEHGFRAVVNTNEPGTAQSYPAGAIINSPYRGPVAPAATPVSIVHEAPVQVSAHAVPVSYPTKSVVSHVAPAPVFDLAVPTVTFDHAARAAISHTVPSAYSAKSVLSHDVPVTFTQAISVPYDHSLPLAFSSKPVVNAPIQITRSAPLTYNTKSLRSHAAPIKTITHGIPLSISNPALVSYSSKSLLSNALPTAKRYVAAPIAVDRYRSIYNGGLGFGRFGYNHGLLGHRLGGLAYNTKIDNHGFLGHSMKELLYRNTLDHGYHRYGPYIGGLTYGKGYGYDGLKSYYY